MTSPASTTVNIVTALNQALESSSGTPAGTAFAYSCLKEWPVSGVVRSLYIQAFGKGAAADGATGGGGAPGGACWFDCSLTASATAKATAIIAKLKGSGASGPFG